MPSKVKVNAIASGSAGFLKPTFSSKSKAIEKGDGRPFLNNQPKRPGVNRKNETTKPQTIPIRLPVAEQENLLHSTVSTTASTSPQVLKKPFETEIDREKQNISAEHFRLSPKGQISDSRFPAADLENERKIRDARSMCDELRLQIESLKKQQKEFQSRLSGQFEVEKHNSGDDSEKNQTSNSLTQQGETKHQKFQEKPQKTEHKNGAGDILPPGNFSKSILKSLTSPKANGGVYAASEDNFSLHGSVTSSDISDLLVADQWLGPAGLPRELVPPNKVIKRLLSERERYKKKVKHLQMALHRLKKQKTSLTSRTPDIATHDVVYFNADLIGEGSISYVYSGTIYKDQKAAVKKLVRPDMMSTSDRSYLAAEAGLLMALHHQNIVGVFGVSTAPLQPLIITELVKGKSLDDRLHMSDGWPLSPTEYYSIARDVAVGMAYLHGQKPPILHLNLRPRNVLIDSSNRAKVSDFGFSKIRLDAGITDRANLAYLAPEVLRYPVHLTTKLDVFSYGVVMWEMATRSKPYENFTPSEVIDNVASGKRLEIPSELPSGFHAIVSRSWVHSPAQRPSFKELLISLETTSLPQEWEDAIEREGLSRADTKGLIMPRDCGNHNTKMGLPESSRPDASLHFSKSPSKSERRKLSDEFALESDMITHGYALSKPDLERGNSENYLLGFRNSTAATQNQSPRTNWRNRNTPSGHQQRSLASRLSPYKYSFVPASPFSVRAAVYPSPDPREKKPLGFKAARNLDRELDAALADGGVSPGEDAGATALYGRYHEIKAPVTSQRDQNPRRLNGHVGRRKAGSRSSSETDALPPSAVKKDNREVSGPLPLTNRNMRYHDQDLAVETPKIVAGRGRQSQGRLKVSESQSPRSPEDLRMAVSIPYLKNLRSGDEISSTSGDRTNRSQFDEKLSTYVSQACRAESQNYVDARMKGWRSDRSNILNLVAPTVPSPSDNVKVRSVGTGSAAVHLGFSEGNGRNASSALSRSPETVMTASYKPEETKRKELRGRGGHKFDDIISPTLSDHSLEETRRIGVASIPSTTTGSRHIGGDPVRTRHVSEGVDPTHLTNPSRLLRRENSWNKLKNSYSPEPLMPHFAPTFGALHHSAGIPLPPALSGAEHLDHRSSAFTRLDSHLGSKSSPKKRDVYRSRNARRKETVDALDRYSVGIVDELERDHGSNSTLSSSANDEIGDVLADTAKELTGVSGILETALVQRKRNAKQKRNGQKSRK